MPRITATIDEFLKSDTASAATLTALEAMDAEQVRAAKGAMGVPFVNAKTDFGAAGDDATNDTAALQAAIEYLGDLGGGVLYLPGGTYRLGRTTQDIIPAATDKHCIALRSGVTLMGDGPDVTILKPLENVVSDTQVIISYPVGAETRVSYVSVRDLTVDGNITRSGVGALGEDEGINIKLTLLAVFDNLIIKNCGQDAIDHDGAAGEGTVIARNCRFIDNYGSGMHTREAYLVVDGCHFENNAHEKALDVNPAVAAYATALDCTSTPVCFVSNCTFKDNNIDVLGGNGNFTNCYFENGGGRTSVRNTTAARWTNCRWLILGSTSTAINCTTAGDGAGIVSGTGGANSRMLMTNCSITSEGDGIKSSDGGEIGMTGGSINANVKAVNLTDQSGKRVAFVGVTIDGHFYVNGAGGGTIEGCTFNRATGTCVELTNGASNWSITNNVFALVATHSLRIAEWDGGANSIGIFCSGNIFNAPVQVRCGPNLFRNNKFAGAVDLNTLNGTGSTWENNEFTAAITGSSGHYNTQFWRRNYGSGISGVFSGTATLVSGTATVSTAAAYSGSKFRLTRQSVNGSTAIGALTIGAITSGTSVVVNALNSSATTATGDTSVVFWEIEN